MKVLIFSFLLIFVQSVLFSQAKNASVKVLVAPVSDSNQIETVQDYKVKKLLAKHVEINANEKTRGYRVKIHFGADKNQAYDIKKKFLELFPDVPAYAKYDQPNFNIRVGDFRTKLEAYNFLKKVEVEFPAAFLVQDEIEFPLLESTNKKSEK